MNKNVRSANVNLYYNENRLQRMLDRDQHRAAIGGMWEEVGKLQFDFLVSKGLAPNHRLLDVGCGCLRGGMHFIPYLDTGNYYGIDLSQALLDRGYNTELPAAGLQDRMPQKNLHQTAEFDATGFGVTFDMALAVSVFSHLPFNHIRLALARLAPVMKPGATFFATIFEVENAETWDQPFVQEAENRTTYAIQDPYHYTRADMEYVCAALPWTLSDILDWKHPRGQRMCAFVKT